MAFLINGQVVVNNNESIDALGVSTFVNIRATGVGTMSELRLGTDTDGYGGVSTDISSDSPSTKLASASAIKTYVDDRVTGGTGAVSLNIIGDTGTDSVNLSSGNLTFSGTTNEIETAVTNDVVTFSLPDDVTIGNNLTVTTDLDVSGSFSFDGGGQSVDAISDDITSAALSTEIPTANAVKSYVDSTIDGSNNLAFSGDSGTNGDIDLAASEVLDFQGTTNQIETVSDGAQQITFSLANDTDIVTSLTVGATLGAAGGDILEASATAAGGGIGVAIAGDLNVTGNVDSASDRKLKENIEVIPNALEKIEALRGVEYTWKSNGAYSAGIIAQEVQAVMPGLVTENETHLSVQYNGLIGLLIEGMKEQQAQIEELKAQLS
ncbi:baseplate wedge subunit [Synechococcus phage S-CAM7]|uniref:Peptidase S74 domain-containing protein n=1 Tax=Synechococcus phage S-CAM7 TaxID=1883368 RepID=A0A1D8KU59_9CAUD|nr:baseplate wedge subunit [Synechococcus phage S-CAM7]AOV62177.1 hypothetical protein C490910_255 [Synechococcus phage S-CAM7]AOV62441.1 hypothetical protein S420910_254 [Synechococcus phage S-CAM7]QLF86309.1 hypothetical protein CC030809_00261 [Synechococcus phage S-CAM7]